MGSSAGQGKLWGAAPQDWVDNERFGIPLYEAVFDAVALTTGIRLLDLGCGAGLAMQMAVQRGASVTGIDAAEGLPAVAHQRVPAAHPDVGRAAAASDRDRGRDSHPAGADQRLCQRPPR
jgi:trans-aconitate methyltransferase